MGDGWWWRHMVQGRARFTRTSAPPPSLSQLHDAGGDGRSGPTIENDGEGDEDEDEDGGCEEPEGEGEKPESTVAHEARNGEAVDDLEVLK